MSGPPMHLTQQKQLNQHQMCPPPLGSSAAWFMNFQGLSQSPSAAAIPYHHNYNHQINSHHLQQQQQQQHQTQQQHHHQQNYYNVDGSIPQTLSSDNIIHSSSSTPTNTSPHTSARNDNMNVAQQNHIQQIHHQQQHHHPHHLQSPQSQQQQQPQHQQLHQQQQQQQHSPHNQHHLIQHHNHQPQSHQPQHHNQQQQQQQTSNQYNYLYNDNQAQLQRSHQRHQSSPQQYNQVSHHQQPQSQHVQQQPSPILAQHAQSQLSPHTTSSQPRPSPTLLHPSPHLTSPSLQPSPVLHQHAQQQPSPSSRLQQPTPPDHHTPTPLSQLQHNSRLSSVKEVASTTSNNNYLSTLPQTEIRVMEFNKRLQNRPSMTYRTNPLPSYDQSDDLEWWEEFVSDFFRDDAILALQLLLDDKLTTFVLQRGLITKFFRSYFIGGAIEMSINLQNAKETRNRQTVTLESDQASIITKNNLNHPKLNATKVVVCTDGNLSLEFIGNNQDPFLIKSWKFKIRVSREYIDRSITAMGLPNTVLFEPTTLQGFPKTTMSYLRMCSILEPMQDIMSQYKQTKLDPRTCLKRFLFEKHRFTSDEDSGASPVKRRKRRQATTPAAKKTAAAPKKSKTSTPVNNSTENVPTITKNLPPTAVVGEPLRMEDYCDDNERLITKVENSDHIPAEETKEKEPEFCHEVLSLEEPNNDKTDLQKSSPPPLKVNLVVKVEDHEPGKTTATATTSTNTNTSTSTCTSTDTSTNTDSDIKTNTDTDIKTNIGTDISSNTSADISTNTSTDISTNTSTDMSTNTSTDMSTNTSIDMSTNTVTDMSTNTGTDTSTSASADTITHTSNSNSISTSTKTCTSISTGTNTTITELELNADTESFNDDTYRPVLEEPSEKENNRSVLNEEISRNSVAVQGENHLNVRNSIPEDREDSCKLVACDSIVAKLPTSVSNKQNRRRSSERKETLREGLMRTSDFVIAMKDLKSEHPSLWRITTGNNLLQQFEPKTQNGVVLYENTNQYAGWNPEIKKDYVGVDVRLTQHTRNQITVERLLLNFQYLEDSEKFHDKHFLIYLQILISTAIDPKFWDSIENEPQHHDYFLTSRKIVEDIIKRHKLKLSSRLKLSPAIMRNFEKYPHLIIKPIDTGTTTEICRACNTNPSTQIVTFGNRSYDLHSFKPVKITSEPTKIDDKDHQTNICDPCLNTVKLYSEVHHMGWKFFNIVKEKAEQFGKGKSVKAILDDCLSDEEWINMNYSERDSLWSRIDQV